MMQCYYCGSDNLMYMWSNYTCKDCCTEQNCPDLIPDEFHVHYETLYEPERKGLTDIFSDIENLNLFKSNVLEVAQNMYKDYMVHHSKMAASQQECFAYACVYFAGKLSKESYKPRKFFASLCDECEFHKATKSIIDQPIDAYKHLVSYNANQDKTSEESIKVLRMFKYAGEEAHQLKRTVYKICDYIAGEKDTKTIHLATLSATIVYMAHMFNKIKVTMTQIAKTCNVTLASMIKVEKILKDILVAKKKS